MVTTLFGNNLRRVILLLVVGVFVSMAGAFAAPPVNDACDSALLVTPGVAISGQTLNNEATFAPDDPELSCAMGPGFGSVFFEFVATYTSARIRTDVDSVGLDSDFAVYAVDQINYCDKSLWTEVGCSEDGLFEFNGDICIEGLTIGDTYKIMLVSFTEGSSGEYTLQIDSPCPGASGDADGDGVPDAEDSDPLDPNICRDVDNDGCDDCTSGTDDPNNDGPDNDSDGICDAGDVCPATPSGETVDTNGCSETQLDDDGDNVNNALDLCPATPAGETVDTNGCSATQLDDDGDEVSNALDLCPATPSGETVGANGCSATQLDDDGDRVSNALDQCPATPTGETVDANGCSATQLDDDGDGINNAADQCPNTPSGETVDATGCPNPPVDSDADGDGVIDDDDNCPNVANPDQADCDGDGIGDVCDEDVTPLTVTASAFPDYLWPANHKMHQIFWTGTAINCDGSPSALTIVTVTSDEADNGWNAGDGNTWNDISWDDDGNLFLRAERAARGDGRVYTITVCSTDASGSNTGSTTFTVEVPHDSGSHSCDDAKCDLNSSATTE